MTSPREGEVDNGAGEAEFTDEISVKGEGESNRVTLCACVCVNK